MAALRLINSLYLIGTIVVLTGCAPFYQENQYGNGYYPDRDSEDAELSSQSEQIDYQAFQSNFMTIDVSQVSYKITETLSYVTLRGNCFNPGFEFASIYYRAFDQEGFDIASDGLPYATNRVFYRGTSKLQPINLGCSEKGLWATVIEVPTWILYQLDKGYLEVSIVAWYKGEEMHNDSTGVTSVMISPPPLEPAPAL